MHKVFYASGFLYHPPTQQILLHQSDKDDLTLSTFRGKNVKNESPEDVFRRVVSEMLGLDLPPKHVLTVYDYFHQGLDAHYYVLFAKVRKPSLDYKLNGTTTIGWFPLKQLPKLKLSEKVRQDIIVGQRVINYIERQKQEALAKKEA